MIAASQKRTFSKMHSHTISLPGQTLTALSANESAAGPPVVFIHGITASGNLWLPSMPAEIRDGRRWISLSLPGHYPAKIDRSTIESWDVVTSEIWASWYQTALQQLIGDEPTDFVGWSTGGFTSLAMGVHFPKRVRSILSISGFAIGEWLGLIGRFQRMSLSALDTLDGTTRLRLGRGSAVAFRSGDRFGCWRLQSISLVASLRRVHAGLVRHLWSARFRDHGGVVPQDFASGPVGLHWSHRLPHANCRRGLGPLHSCVSHALDCRSSARCGIGVVARSRPYVLCRADSGVSGSARSLVKSFLVLPSGGIAA